MVKKLATSFKNSLLHYNYQNTGTVLGIPRKSDFVFNGRAYSQHAFPVFEQGQE